MVEEATRAEEDPAVTFCRVHALASAAHGNRMPAVVPPALSRQRKRPPRLTEPWFCCAEPTEGQFGLLQSRSGEGI